MSKKIAVSVKAVTKSFTLHNSDYSVKSRLINLLSGKRSKKSKNNVLQNVSLDIHEGDFFAIVGRNGSGKSTLLKMIAGVYSPTKGAIEVNGRLVPFIELGVGFNPELTGRDNVYLNGALLGFSRKEITAMFDDIVKFAELEDFMHEKLKNYSSGMQVRLAFSIAIRAKSDILLIDEVLAVGDALFQQKCFRYFRKLKQEKKTVIFVSHDAEAIERYCDKAALINDGRIDMIGTTKKVLNRYTELLSSEEQQAVLEPEEDSEKPKAKPVKIRSIRLNGKPAKERAQFKFGQAVELEIDLKVDKDFKTENINCAIGIYNGLYDAGGDYEVGFNTVFDSVSYSEDKTTILLKIKQLNLRNGKHYLYVSVYGDSEELPYDYKPEAAVFITKGAPDLTSRGTIITDHSWS